MFRSLKPAFLMALCLAIPAVPARAQYGWGGWGGATAEGSRAMGAGVYAAGAGAYNEQTAQARSMNAQTAMQWNNYMYQCNQRNAANEVLRMQRRQQAVVGTQKAAYDRLHNNPEPRDIHDGDALNIVLTELVNPKVYTQVVQKSTQPVDSRLVKTIPFSYAAKMILISLDDLSDRGVPDDLATNPAFEADRKSIRAIIAKGKEEGETTSRISPATLRSFRTAITAIREKVAGVYAQGTRQRDEADNFLKALYGLSNMLERPDIEQFLKGLDKYPNTTLGHLVTFMHSFNLRFGPANTPEQEATYDQIYPLLVAVRDQAQAQGPNLMDTPPPAPDSKSAASHFSSMSFENLQPGQRAAPAPPAPDR